MKQPGNGVREALAKRFLRRGERTCVSMECAPRAWWWGGMSSDKYVTLGPPGR